MPRKWTRNLRARRARHAGTPDSAAIGSAVSSVEILERRVLLSTATQLAFTQEPTSTSAGSSIAPTITVSFEDTSSDVVTSDDAKVSLSIQTGPSGAVINGTTTVRADDGTATFSDLSLNTAGTYKLVATSNGLVDRSDKFFISAGVAAKLVIVQQPTSAVAGVAINPAIVVDVEDQYGNISPPGDATPYVIVPGQPISLGPTATLSIQSGPVGAEIAGGIFGAVNGVATFNDVTLDTAGSYKLTASYDGLNINTTRFAISPAAPSQLVFNQQPTTTAVDASIMPAPVVAIEDQFGNIETGDDSKVKLAIQSGPAGAIFSGASKIFADNGTATFTSLSLNEIGTYKFVVTNGSLTGHSNKFAVIPSAPAKLAFLEQPSAADATVPIAPPITVEVEDQFGNLITSDTSSVTLAFSSTSTGSGSLSYAGPIAAVNGVATFGAMTISTSGVYRLTATDGTLQSVNSLKFTIAAAPTTPTLNVLASFNNTNGSSPQADLILDTDGDLFGTTADGGDLALGEFGGGTVFELPAGSGAINDLVQFNSDNGDEPKGALLTDTSGDFFGTTTGGETVFELTGGSISTLATFNGSEGSFINGDLVRDDSGNFYGSAEEGGNGNPADGDIFKVPNGGGTPIVLASFGGGSSGSGPNAGLVFDTGGNLYGTTGQGGSANPADGTIFELQSGASTATILASFDGSDGDNPDGTLIRDSSGDLFGVTQEGGASALEGAGGDGTVFELAAGSPTVTVLASFTGANGELPSGDLLMDAAGDLFGTTEDGGDLSQNSGAGDGIVWELPAGTHTIRTLATFEGTIGGQPEAGLVADANGNLFGTTTSGGENGYGEVFEIVGSGFVTGVESSSAGVDADDPSLMG